MAKLNTQEIEEMRQQMQEDFDLYSLVAYKAEPKHQAYTSPAPRNDFLKVFDSVNKASLTWRIVVPDEAPAATREAANRGEALLTGILNRADRRLRRIGEPALRVSLCWYGCNRGVGGLRCLIYKGQKGETEIDIRALDPLHSAFEAGVDGLVWGASIYTVGPGEAQERWGLTLSGQTATVIDYFNRKIHAAILSEGTAQGKYDTFVKEPTEHGLDHVPMWFGFASGMPTVFDKDGMATLKQRAASVYASARNIYEARNRQVSFVMDVAEKSVAGTLVANTETGDVNLKGDPWGAWQVIPLKLAEKITPLMPPPVPSASGIILGVLDRDKQESTIPYPIGYGIDPGSHSGAALALMDDNTRSVYGPYANMVAEGFLWLCEEILGQFKLKGQKIALQGFNASGKFFEMEASPDDIKDDWYVEVKCEPKLPRDEASDIMMAIQASTPGPDGEPLLSRFTAREKIVKVQNPDAEKSRIESEKVERLINSMPNIQIRRVAKALLDQGDEQGALELMNSIPSPQAEGPVRGAEGPVRGGASPGPGTAPTTPPPPAASGPPPPPGAGSPGGNGAMMQAMEGIIVRIAQQLGVSPAEVAQMPPEQVMAMMQSRGIGTGG